MKTWSQVIQGIVMRGRCDYILEAVWPRFKMVVRRGVINHPLDNSSLRSSILIFPMDPDHHCGAGGIPAQIGAVHGVREDSGS